MIFYRYAEAFGCHPQDVPRQVESQFFFRWLMLRKAEAAQDAWRRWNSREKGARPTEEDNKLRAWTMLLDEE